MNPQDEVPPTPNEIRAIADTLERLSEADGVPLPEMAEWSPSLLRARAVIGEDELAAEASLVADAGGIMNEFEGMKADEVPGEADHYWVCGVKVAKCDDPYSEVNQQAAAWRVIVRHPVIGPISSLPERGTYADMVRARLDDVLAQLEASPSLPDVKSPEALRFAADALDTLGAIRSAWSPYKLRQLADEREREQAVETAQDHAIEQAAQMAFDANNTDSLDVTWDTVSENTRESYRRICRALADADLLNTGEQ